MTSYRPHLLLQLQALLSEEKCSKLLALHSYECTRGGSEELYHSNIVDLLAEERCFRFEFNQVSVLCELDPHRVSGNLRVDHSTVGLSAQSS